MRLVWNAIVKNEGKIIRRCVESLLPWIDGAIIVDTGSTDGTPELIMNLFAMAKKPVEIHQSGFLNFEQARNEALQKARDSQMPWDWLILVDADMELKVTDEDWRNQLAGGFSFDMRQSHGGVGYLNRRLLSRDAPGWYVGVTHEYLDSGPSGTLDGAEFIDHADGSSRPSKLHRDIDLLEKALETETRRGMIERYTFYLANSYYEATNWVMAVHHYKKRIAMGGFDEERYISQHRYAHCLKGMGDNNGFVAELLKAHNMRPSRVEALYDLAHYYREHNEPHAGLVFAWAGMQIPKSKDMLFVNEYAHDVGCPEEFAICAYYNEHHRKRGAVVTDMISLSRQASEFSRQQARGNQYWYLETLDKFIHTFKTTRIPFKPPEGWVALNPSVINRDGEPLVLVRTVNYWITPEGVYAIRGVDGSYSRDNPINTRNYIVALDRKLRLQGSYELALPNNWPEPKFDLVRGFEDSRLFLYGGVPYTSSTVRELTDEGWCEQVLAPIGEEGYGSNWKVIKPEPIQHEKNWMPWIRDSEIQFVYRLNHLIDVDGKPVARHQSIYSLDHISGGSQVVGIGTNEFLAVVHEAGFIPGQPTRYYKHRFVIFEPNGSVKAISRPFCFQDKQIEFAAGIAFFPQQQKLMVSYGVRDCEAWLATMAIRDVRAFIYRNHRD